MKSLIQLIFFVLCFNLPAFSQVNNSVQQRREMSKEFGITDEQGKLIQRYSKIRSQQIDSLNKLGLPEATLISKRDLVTDQYYELVAEVLGDELNTSIDLDGCRAARSSEIKQLNLGMRQSVQMGSLKYKYESQVLKLKEEQLPKKVFRIKQETIEKTYRNEVRALIGDEKFAQWIDYQNHAIDRQYERKYGMDKDQIKKSKNALSKELLSLQMIKHSKMTEREKSRKRTEIKLEYVNNMKQILSADQFAKWCSDYDRKQVSSNK